MRTIWNGSISFGLVNIPVGLALATTPKAKQSDVSFRTLHRECKTPIRQKRWCPTHEREVGPDEIVKGWEVAKGEFVVVEDTDLEAIQQHDESRSIWKRSIRSTSTARITSRLRLPPRSAARTCCCSRR
jgi:DNA end-binding protein Ku